MTDTTAHPAELDDLFAVVELLARRVALLIEQVALITDVLELDEPGYFRSVVDLPDIATYQPEEHP